MKGETDIEKLDSPHLIKIDSINATGHNRNHTVID